MTLATKIAVLKDGEVQQVGTPSEIYNRPANLFVADFMGNPAMNLMEASVVSDAGRTLLSLTRGTETDIRLPVPGSVEAGGLGDGRKVILEFALRRSPTRTGRTTIPPCCRSWTLWSRWWSPRERTPSW